MPWALTLSPKDRQLAGALSDAILPPQHGFPAPSNIGIAEFLDEWISAPYPQQVDDRQIVLSGLALVDAQSREMFQQNFTDLTADQMVNVVEKISEAELGGQFFVRFRYLVVGGYFTSDIGMAAIGYVGNVPLQRYVLASAEVMAILEEELERLGLPRTGVIVSGGPE